MSAGRLAMSNIAWDAALDADAAALLRAREFGGVEIAPTKRWERPLDAEPLDIMEFATLWQARELPIVAMQALLFGRPDLQLFGDTHSRDALLEYLGGIIELGGALGARTLVFGSPKNRARGPMPLDDAMEVAAEFFALAAALAEASRVVLCIEPNPPAYGCDFVTTTDEAIELVRRVDHPCLRVQGDLGAMTMNGENVASSIRRAAPYLAHFHASEPHLVEVGTGGAPHDRAAAALRDVGYTGWVSIEMRAVGDPAAQCAAVERAAKFVAETYGFRSS